jgi:hypothetical protein
MRVSCKTRVFSTGDFLMNNNTSLLTVYWGLGATRGSCNLMVNDWPDTVQKLDKLEYELKSGISNKLKPQYSFATPESIIITGYFKWT